MKPSRKRARASAPAKVILFGEHFVVHGEPAIIASVNKRVHVDVRAKNDDRVTVRSNTGFAGSFSTEKLKTVRKEEKGKKKNLGSAIEPVLAAAGYAMREFDGRTGLDIAIKTEFPYGVGLGSSAATAVATIAAVGSLFGRMSKGRISDLSLKAERLVHSNPSGADSVICTYGGLMLFRRDGEEARPIKNRMDLQLAVVNSGIKRVTGSLVSNVGNLRKSDPELFGGLASMSSSITAQALKAIRSRNYAEVGALMTLNHSLLRRLGVSRKILDRLVNRVLGAGALGAKMTGAGGGGSIIVLVTAGSRKRVLRSVREYDAFVSGVEPKGVVVENTSA